MALFCKIKNFSDSFMKGYENMRIDQHPILTFERGREISFTFNGEPMKGSGPYNQSRTAMFELLDKLRSFQKRVKILCSEVREELSTGM